MKKHRQGQLRLNRETIRNLTSLQLQGVAGAVRRETDSFCWTVCPSKTYCPAGCVMSVDVWCVGPSDPDNCGDASAGCFGR